jgi:short-chain fatty acids transporter
MFNKLADAMSTFVKKYLPDAFAIAIFLTLLTMLLGVLLEGKNIGEMIAFWGDGFWVFLRFSMQMAMVLVTGIVLADVPIIHKMLNKLASLPKTSTQAYIMTFLLSTAAYYINWGLAVVVGAIFARAIYKRMKNINYPLLIAAAYVATATFPGGLSSSIPLLIATPGHFLEGTIGLVPTSETIFHYSNIIILIGIIITTVIVLKLMAPKEAMVIDRLEKVEEEKEVEEVEVKKVISTPAEKIENSLILAVLMGAAGIFYAIMHFINGGGLNLNIINITFLSLGIILHGSPIKVANAFKNAGFVVTPIMLQFPFYAGIMGMLSGSGLAASMAAGLISFATVTTFPMLTYWSAGLVNMLAPSAGGQWGIQGPIQIQAGMELGVKPSVIAMSVAWGDAWTNTIQPFWALPILALAGLKIRDIMGYCILIGVSIGIVTSILMLLVY